MSVRNLLATFPLLLVAACVHLQPVAPDARTSHARAVSVVRVESSCGGWAPRSGTGVIISQRHVLTAAHVVSCTMLPHVRVTYIDDRGRERRLRMYVTEEDPTADIAKLEIASAESFQTRIRPPIVREPDPGNRVCANLASSGSSLACGAVASTWTAVTGMSTERRDDGAPVYCEYGTLVGIVVSRGKSSAFPYAWIAPIDPRWLAGVVPGTPDPRVDDVLARARGTGAPSNQPAAGVSVMHRM